MLSMAAELMYSILWFFFLPMIKRTGAPKTFLSLTFTKSKKKKFFHHFIMEKKNFFAYGIRKYHRNNFTIFNFEITVMYYGTLFFIKEKNEISTKVTAVYERVKLNFKMQTLHKELIIISHQVITIYFFFMYIHITVFSNSPMITRTYIFARLWRYIDINMILLPA